MTLKPDANNPFPMTWNILPPNAHFDVRLHRGGGKSIQSWLPESSVGSWLPPSSSKQKSVRAASSTMMSHRIAKPCNNVKKTISKENGQSQCQKRSHSWTCPECFTSFQGSYGSVMGSRLFHWKSRHPEKPVETLFHTKSPPYAVSHQMPKDEQAWECPLSTAALPSLPRYDRQAAIKQHGTECHPERTPNSLRKLNLKGVKRPGTAEAQRKKFEKL